MYQIIKDPGFGSIISEFQTAQPSTPDLAAPIRNYKSGSPQSFIPPSVARESFHNYDQNNFVLFLNNEFGAEITNRLIKKYHIGTSGLISGGTLFWYCDIKNLVRTGTEVLCDPTTGKPHQPFQWVHENRYPENFNFNPCFFGEHLLATADAPEVGNWRPIRKDLKPIAITTTETTAIIASAYLPEYVWLSTPDIESITPDKWKMLTGRTITLFPDCHTYIIWNKQSKKLTFLPGLTLHHPSDPNPTPHFNLRDRLLHPYPTNIDEK